jgi:hypothetical protein
MTGRAGAECLPMIKVAYCISKKPGTADEDALV